NNVLASIFSDLDDAKKILLAGDINIAPDPTNPGATGSNTAPGKRVYFLVYFLPFLRQQLSYRFIADTMAGAVSLIRDVTLLLLSDILNVPDAATPATPLPSAMDVLEQTKDQPANSGSDWSGYLIPSADAVYTFIAQVASGDLKDKPDDLLLD